VAERNKATGGKQEATCFALERSIDRWRRCVCSRRKKTVVGQNIIVSLLLDRNAVLNQDSTGHIATNHFLDA
jgi:hypothetical protein